MMYESTTTRHNWTKEEIIAIYNKPFMDLLFEAASIYREHHDPNAWCRFPLYYRLKPEVVRNIRRVLPTGRLLPYRYRRQRFNVGFPG